VGAVFPVAAPVAASNLKESGWESDLDFDILRAQEDIIRRVAGTSFAEEVFHYAGAAGDNGWHVQGALDESWAFQPTQGYVFFIKGPSGRVWRQTVPFTP
jgi:hypothetical protein